MSWKVYGETIATADMSGTPTKVQTFVPDENIVIAAIRTWIEFHNDPAFDEIFLRIYANREGSPGDLLFTSDGLAKTDLLGAYLGGRLECAFLFDPKPFLRGGDTYHLALYASSYTGNDTSFFAWIKAWPQATLGTDPDFVDLHRSPYAFNVIGGKP